MSIIRGIGKYAGKAAGLVIGGPIQIIGEFTGVELIEDIGKGVRTASEFAGDTAGQVVSGAVDTVSGIINEDPTIRDKGLSEMGSAVGRTAKGIVVTVKGAVNNGGEVIGGFIDGDNNRIKQGASSLLKTVAVGALAVGVVDVVDGVDVADAEEHPVDDTHEVSEPTNTDVPYLEKTIEKPHGEIITDTYPIFDAKYEVTIEEDLYLRSDYVHFSYANHELYEAIQENPGITADLGFSEQDIQNLANGENPEGYTWHHNEDPGLLQLVDHEVHAENGHTGGRELWGGGEEYR
jgi:hypothetical protein